MNVLHVITDLDTGGAEMMLYKVLSATDDAPRRAAVICLTEDGPVGERIRALGVPVRLLGMKRRFPNPLSLVRLAHWIRTAGPDVVQTWMYHADLIGGVAARLSGVRPVVVWGVRASDLDQEGISLATRLVARLSARLAWLVPNQIICCSRVAVQFHEDLGYPVEKFTVIPNGFDLSTFHLDPPARVALRSELGIPDDALLVGCVARFHPMKDHRTFVRAAAKIGEVVKDSYFLLCGDGVTWRNSELAGWIDAAGLRDRFRLLGCRDDMPRIMSALDIHTLVSASEGFPNVLGEAMACGVPCVATDVGDCGFIIGDTGRLVAPKNPQSLAEAWLNLYRLGPEGRQDLGRAALKRVQEHFRIQAVTARYETLYRETIVAARDRRRVAGHLS